jgi:hypothetical protein
MDHLTVKLEQDLASMDEGNGEEQVRSRSMNLEPTRSRDNMKWIISFVIWLVHVLHQHWRRWNGMCKAKV